MLVRRPLATLLLFVFSCSEPFQAGSVGGDAQSSQDEPDATADTSVQPDEGELDTGPADGSGDVSGDVLDAEKPLAPPIAQDLILWLRADAGVTEMRGTVVTWADQSGHHSDAVQTDPMKQP